MKPYPIIFNKGRQPHYQRGVASIMTAIFILFVALGCAALVIDSGRLYMEQRDLQRIADNTALDTAQQAGLCGGNTEAVNMAQAAAKRNGFDGTFGNSRNDVLLGRVENKGGHWTFFEDTDQAEAVYVQVSKQVPASIFLGGIMGMDDLILSKQAVARRTPVGTLKAGSGLVSIDSQDSIILNAVLDELLDTSLSLDAVSYQGLADARVKLLDLVEAETSAGTIDELLSARLGLNEMLTLFADAASESGAASATLNGLLSGAGAVRTTALTLGDILTVASPTQQAALEAEMGLLDLISAAAMYANRDNALTVPLGASLGLPGLANVEATLELYIIEAPQLAVGLPGRDADGGWRTRVETAQVRSSIQGEAVVDLLSLVRAEAILGVALDAAAADAWFESITCSTYSRQSFQDAVLGAQTELANLSLGRFSSPGSGTSIEDNAEITLTALGGLLPSLLEAEISSYESVSLTGSPAESLYFCDGTPCRVAELPLTARAGGGADLGVALSGLLNTLELEVNVAGLGISSDELELALLEDLVGPLLTGFDELLNPVFRALGISVGYVDVTLVDVEMEQVELVR